MATPCTHYAYVVDTRGRDIPTKTFNLYGAKTWQRRELISKLINDYGECLARLPLKFHMMNKSKIDLRELELFINGEFEP